MNPNTHRIENETVNRIVYVDTSAHSNYIRQSMLTTHHNKRTHIVRAKHKDE